MGGGGGGGGVIEHTTCILIFCTTFVGKFSHSKENAVRYYRNCVYVLM